MDIRITPRNIGIWCRVCLTSSKNLVHLASAVEDTPIHSMLESVVFNKVVLDDKKFPSNICQICLSLLKIAYDFQAQFNKSQKVLERVCDGAPVEDKKKNPAVEVELIYGANKFDLNDVVVVENSTEDKVSFDGFLRNLGSEISANVINKSAPLIKEQSLVEACNVEIVSLKKPVSNHTNLDISKLTVKQYPEENKIVIEDKENNRIVKTLYECAQCMKKFTLKRNFDIHTELKHCTHRTLMCDKCGHLAHTQSQLYHHLRKHKGKLHKCTLCDKRYDTMSHLRCHLDTHKNERRFLCNVCGKNFNYAVSLKYHLRLHADKQFVCNICGLKFRMPNTLKRHIRTHTKDKPYPCGYCEKRFPSRGEQVSHQMIHTGERPYHCEYCGKEFIKSVNLQSHYLSHPGPHQCHLCAKSFLEMRFLKLHIKRAHKDYDIIEVMET